MGLVSRNPELASKFALLLAVLSPSLVAAAWTSESPQPTFLEIRGVAAPSPGKLFLATDDDSFDAGGALFESNDAGATWTQRAVPAGMSDALHGIQFLDAQRGWAWGNVNHRTTDGGATWQQLPFLGSTYGMEFSTPNFGVARGNFGSQVSRDGGLSWAESPAGLYAFSFATDAIGLGVGAGGIHRTADGGASFVVVRAGAGSAVKFLSASVAVAIVDDTFVRSVDGGQTWTAAGPAAGRTGLVVVSQTVALAWGRTGGPSNFDDRLFRTADAGQSWADLGEPIAIGANSTGLRFTLASAGTIVAADGAGNLDRSTDAGATWNRVFATPGPRPGFLGTSAPVFADALNGFYGMGGGYLVRTADGGATWAQLSSGAAASLADLDRFPNGDRIAVGEGGAVLTSPSTGSRWTLRGGAGNKPLVAVQVTGAQSAVALDEDGVLHASADGGLTWTAGAAPTLDVEAADLSFDSPASGWLVGRGFDGAALFRTQNGGTTWSPAADFEGNYVAVDFAGNGGWALRSDGLLQRTANGGTSWTSSNLPGTADDWFDVDFWNASVGYAVGDSGHALRSGNGGLTWQRLPTPNSTDRLTDLYLLGADELWIAASDGTALYSANGGLNWSAMEAGPNGFGTYTAIVAQPDGDAWLAGYRGAIRHFDGPPPPPLNQPPVASFDFVTTGLSVAFDDTSTDADGTIVAWAWVFGDGATSNLQNPTHLYATAGTYLVRLTVTDDDGETDVAGAAIVVQPGPGGTFGEFTEITPLDPLFVTPQDEDFWVTTTAPADYDGDGDLDMAVLGFYVVYNESVEDMLVLLRNDGPAGADVWDFTYVEVPLGEVTSGASDLAWGDVDGDGDPDLVLGSEGDTVLYRNDAGTLVPTNTVLPGYWEDNFQADFDLRSISWADFDNDGDLDLLLPSVWDDEEFEFRTALLRNEGSNGSGGWTFTEVAAGFAPTAHAQSAWADFDGDSDLDLLLIHLAPLTDDGFIRRYRNDGDGVFVGEDILGALTVEHGEAQWGDADDDGDLDILVAGHVREIEGGFANVLRIYRNDQETYTAVEVIDCPQCDGWFDLSAATWADYDSDGDVDILLAGSYNSGSQIEGRAKIYDNVGGTYVDSGSQLPAPRSSGSRGGSFTWLDLDGEGDLDYFIAGEYFVPGGNGLVEAQMHVYRNDADDENDRPSAPTLLGSEVHADGSVDLYWNPAIDDLTPSDALTYDVQVSRNGAPGAALRRAPEPGGVSAASEWSLEGLADGLYTWTIEAIDSAYNAGPRAQGTFRVGPPPTPLFANGFEGGSTAGWSFVVP